MTPFNEMFIGWYQDQYRIGVVAQGFHDLIDSLLALARKDYYDILCRIAQSGHVALETDHCLSATPERLREYWQKLVAPIASFTQDEQERKRLLAQVLLAVRIEAYKKYTVADAKPEPQAA